MACGNMTKERSEILRQPDRPARKQRHTRTNSESTFHLETLSSKVEVGKTLVSFLTLAGRCTDKPQAAGTICAQSKWWNAATFPRHLVHDCKSVRSGLLMHSKLLLVYGEKDDGERSAAWGYVGSANLSDSAW